MVCSRRVSLASARWRVIALTNNWARSDPASLGEGQPVPAKYAHRRLSDELVFLGWQDGAVPARLREMFDDFCDSSELGMRSVVPEFVAAASDLLTTHVAWQEARTRVLSSGVSAEQHQTCRSGVPGRPRTVSILGKRPTETEWMVTDKFAGT